ncbi:L-glutamine-D-fructose-6-phosphate aminotransferase [Pseudomonas phage UFV-P2]|uniref:Glutamine amidotransferase n=1 Tax=Pseudomonas phage UFV-P2 TaxID=1235661 RepID=K0IMS7_9CAUD|nr:L-glutamine-D-fructose-6-phosphate aminotransferase [Pseudomonas phage UFV-P2]AFU62948.1 glutamine amidotransferase [Pseudomonas phage UFV-P2]
MCGLVGFYTSTTASDDELQLFKNMLVVDQIRGMHATGVAKVTTRTNTVAIHKRAHDAIDYLAAEDTKEFFAKERGNIYIGHNRYATMGNKADHANAHPFQEGHITLAHNGGVDHWALDLLEGNDKMDVDVDSHMVCMTIAKHGVKKAVEEHLSGAFSLVWWDSEERSLNFIRNNDRPLYMAVLTNGNLVWASEKGMLDVFFARSSNKAPKYRMAPEETIQGRHYKFRFTEAGTRIGTGPDVQDLKFHEAEVPKSVAAWFGSHYGSQNQNSSQRNSAANYAANTEERVNNLLVNRGLPFRYKSVVTADSVAVEAYEHSVGFGKIEGVERQSDQLVCAYGIDLEDFGNTKVFRGVVNDAYLVTRLGKQELCVVLGNTAKSCFDDSFDLKDDSYFGTMSQSASKVVELKPKKIVQQGEPVRYPLKTCGHTFPSSAEFVDFVSQGCGGCGKVPTPYDRRNHKLTVYEGKAFQGLLEDCEFLCGECCEEGM